MTEAVKSSGASSGTTAEWKSIDWKTVHSQVRRMQMRIAKAVREGRKGKVKALQWILTHSYYGKLKAIKRVTTNRGKNTPGVDGVIWKTPRQKMQALKDLYRHGYHPKPLRRIYIPKKNSVKKRPLSIPTMRDRAMQALYNLALVPVAETTADRNSYAYREDRSCADAIDQCHTCLCWQRSAPWVYELDIKGCFDNFDHSWMLANIPMDKQILCKWLKAGYIEDGRRYETKRGTPQGGIISPTLCNMTLDGIEEAIRKAAPARSKVNVIRFADDLVVTGSAKDILEDAVIPAITTFLDIRGLQVSREKSRITHIDNGFDFLGQHIRKYSGKLLVKPSKSSIKSLRQKIRFLLVQSRSWKAEELIRKLNATLRGWANYHRHVVSSKTFNAIDHYLFQSMWRWARRRHPNRSANWLIKKYWSAGPTRWHFAVIAKAKRKDKPVYKIHCLLKMSSIKIVRHRKIRGKAHPYDPLYRSYFLNRNPKKWLRAWA